MENLIVLIWWFIISAYSLYNIQKLYYLKYDKNNKVSYYIYQSSCMFIMACSIRSIFPRIDGYRVCMFNSWISYPLVGRILATFGELAFVYQLTLVTKIFARKFNCYKIYNTMNIVMGLIFIAQIFCWYGVLFQRNMMHVIEESIWMITMLSIGYSYFYFYSLTRCKLFVYAFLISIGYTLFMIFIDIPMYYNRYLISNDRYLISNHPEYKSIYNTINDISCCKTISSSYLIWKDAIPWMTGYFIGATFLSIKMNNIQEFLNWRKSSFLL